MSTKYHVNKYVLGIQRLSNSSESSGSSEVSGSSEGPDILFEDEIRGLSVKQKHSSGIKLNIEPTQGLAIKSMIGIPWYRLRILNR